MKFKTILIALCVTLAACGPKQSETGVAEESQSAVPPSSVHMGPAFKEPLAGGIAALPFDYNITLQSSPKTKEGGRSRIVALEFTEGDVPAIDKKLADAFQAVGYQRRLPTVKAGATRSVYTKAGESEVLVWIRPDVPPGQQFKAMSPEGKGTVYLAWKLQ